jgi:hypothetical protein
MRGRRRRPQTIAVRRLLVLVVVFLVAACVSRPASAPVVTARGPDPNARALAAVALAQLLWDRSCPKLADDGTCTRLEPPAHRSACGDDIPLHRPLPRDRDLASEAQTLFTQALDLWSSRPPAAGAAAAALAAARLARVEVTLELVLGRRFPTGFDLTDPPLINASKRRMDDWLDVSYTDLHRLHTNEDDDMDEVGVGQARAAYLCGLGYQQVAAELVRAPIPAIPSTDPFVLEKRRGFCLWITEAAEPLIAKAVELYRVCATRATAAGEAAWAARCEAAAAALKR